MPVARLVQARGAAALAPGRRSTRSPASLGRKRAALLFVITPWMRLVPRARGSDDRLEVPKAWRPAQLALRFVRRRVEDGRIARTPRRERPRHLPAGDALDRIDHLEPRMRAAGSEVVR